MLSYERNLNCFINKGISTGNVHLGDFEKVPSTSSKDFKSDAEKRFAQSCKARGLAYYYEPHTFLRTFRTDDNIVLCYAVGRYQYTPDFYIPALNLYVEVKAQDSQIVSPLFCKYYRFGAQMIKQGGTRFAVINYGYHSERSNKLVMSNFGHPNVEDEELDLLSLLMEF